MPETRGDGSTQLRAPRVRGVVVRCQPGNYGFIVADDDRDAFFSYREVVAQHGPLVRDRVEFEIERSIKGPGWQARNVVIIHPYADSQKFEVVQGHTKEAERAYLDALGHREAGNFLQAKLSFERATRRGASLDAFLAYSDLAQEKLNDPELALAILEQARRQYSTVPRVWSKIARLLWQLNRRDEAIDLLQLGKKSLTAPVPSSELQLAEYLYNRAQRPDLIEARAVLEQLRKHPGRGELRDLQALDNKIKIKLTFHSVAEFMRQAGFMISEETSGKFPILHLETTQSDLRESFDLSGLVETYLIERELTPGVIREMEFLRRHPPKGVNSDIWFVSAGDIKPVENLLMARMEREQDALVPFIIPELPKKEVGAYLRAHLDHWLTQRNLFEVNRPVSGRRFFGREEELRTISRAIDDGNFVGVFGLRKVGKTSFLYQTRDRRRSDIVAYYDLQHLPIQDRHVSFLLWALGSDLGRDLMQKYPADAETLALHLPRLRNFPTGSEQTRISRYFDDDFKKMLAFLDYINPRGKIVVLLDEIETLLPIGGRKGIEGHHDLLGYFRGLSQRSDGRFVLVVSGANPIINEAPRWDGQDNPVFQYLREVSLKPLSRAECDLMIGTLGKGMGVTVSDEALDLIFQETAGHPFMARQLCGHVQAKERARRRMRIELRDVDERIPSFVREQGAVFEEILVRLQEDFPEEYLILSYVAERPLSVAEIRKLTDSDPRQAMKHLLGYYLVGFDGHRYSLTMRLLRRWMQGKGD